MTEERKRSVNPHVTAKPVEAPRAINFRMSMAERDQLYALAETFGLTMTAGWGARLNLANTSELLRRIARGNLRLVGPYDDWPGLVAALERVLAGVASDEDARLLASVIDTLRLQLAE